MGHTVKAALFYGFSLDRPLGIEDWEIRYAEARCLPRPEGRFNDNEAAHRNYYAVRQDLLAEAGCTVGYHGYGNGGEDDLVPYVAITATETRAYPCDVKILAPVALAIDPNWDAKLADFCEKLGIPVGDAHWCLVAYTD